MSSKRKVRATSQELVYRNKHFHDIRVVKDRQIVCASCGNDINIEPKRIFSHSLLEILQCETCWNHFKKVEAEFDEGDEKYCHICGDKKKLYNCSNRNCASAFCKKCIKRNANLSLLEAEKEDWNCYVCDPKPIWELRAVCAAVMDSVSKKSNKRSSNKRERRILPSQKERLKKQRRTNKILKKVCDREDGDNTKSTEKSTSDDSSTNESSSTSHEQRKRFQRSTAKKKNISNRNEISDDSDDSDSNDSINLSSKKTAKRSRRTIKPGIETNKKLKNRKNWNRHLSSDDESEDGDMEGQKNQNRKRRSKSVTSLSDDKNKPGQYKKSIKHLGDVEEEDSSASSSKEFQKVKLQKVNSNKYSARRLVDLDIDYTRSPAGEHLTNGMSTESTDLQSNLDVAEKIVRECKRKCSNFLMYIDSIEQLYRKRDKEQLVLRSKQKIENLLTTLQTKHTDLARCHQSWVKSRNRKIPVTKKWHRVANDDDEGSSEEICKEHIDEKHVDEKHIDEKHIDEKHIDEKRAINEVRAHSLSRNERGDKDVSDCDSEIFSADEMKPSETVQTVQNEVDSSNDNDAKNDGETTTLINESKDNYTNNSRDIAPSPVLSSSREKKVNKKRSINKAFSKSNDKEAQSTEDTDSKTADLKTADAKDKDPDSDVDVDTDIDIDIDNNIDNDNTAKIDAPLKDGSKRVTLQNDGSPNKKDQYNESRDMFDVSFDVSETQEENQMEADCNTRPSSKTVSSNKCKASLQDKDKVSSEKDRTSPLSHNNEEEKDSSENNQDTVMSTSATDENVHDVSEGVDAPEKADTNAESLDDTEALAKKKLLESDSSQYTDANEDAFENNTENINVENSDTDTTVLLQTRKKMNAAKNADVEAKVTEENDDQPDKNVSPSSEDTKLEAAARKALLESNTEDSFSLSSSGSEDKKAKSNSSVENIIAKRVLLESSTENSSSEENGACVSQNKRNTNDKRKRNPESDEDLPISHKKKKSIKLDKNNHYKNDEKLRMSCKVHLTQLSKKVLKRHSHALQKSREYLKAHKEHKAFKSLVNLDNLEKRRKKNAGKDSDASTDDNTFSKVRRSSNKRKEKEATKEESLMDHFKRVENDDIMAVETDLSSDGSVHRVKEIDSTLVSNEALISEADRLAKENLLNSSDSNAEKEVSDGDNSIKNDDEKTEDKKKAKQKRSEEKTSKQEDGKKEKDDKSKWRKDKILTMKFSDTDSDVEEKKWNKKQDKIKEKNNSDSDDEEKHHKAKKKKKKKKKSMRRILDSDSDIKLTDCSSDSSEVTNDNQRHKRRASSDTDSSLEEKKSKPKRKRIKKVASDSDSSDCKVEPNNSQGSTPGKSGRKNIRKVLKDKQVADDTKLAAKEEEERLKRIADRQALYNEMYEMRLAGEEKVDKLVLDFDTETKKELVSVHEELVKRLKPHQAQGIKFMWDACFESLERVKTTSGSGCIIAHCMGLGKTLQVIALTHTLLNQEETGVKTVLVVCPLSTVLNWRNEYNTWLKDLDDIEVYELTKFKKNFERKYQLQRWQKTGGVMIIGYEMFRNLTGPNKNIRKGIKEVIESCLVDPGADLVVCDEGHLLKNEDTALSKCMRRVKTMRRIVLTGTPLQNNLTEYHCMVQFVKPNLLGTKKEFLNRFVNPITNGQFDDSTAYDVKLMKKRAHVLHKMLEGSVQRFDYSVLTPFLPPKQEYVIFVKLTEPQIKMYQYYLTNLARIRKQHTGAGGTLFADFQALQRIWTHPIVMRLNAAKIEKANEKKFDSESEGSLKDFINDDSTDADSSCNASSDSDVQAIDEVFTRKTRNNPGEEEPPEEETKEEISELEWWSQFAQPEHYEDIRVSAKLLLLFEILKQCEQIGDKVLVFSQSLYSLTLIEEFLRRIDDQTQNGTCLETLDSHTGSWSLGLDYFRLDGQTSPENRSMWCKLFNRPSNTRARLFLISTRAGGLGINLTAANRVIIFDASWNPSHDVQSIFRIYRFGQKKPCYVYRFLAAGTMEEKIYNRQVTKLSLSCRVVDEQQIERHYSNHDLNELYMFEAYKIDKPTLSLPKDRLLAEIFLKYKDVVETYHEHDSLLENKAEEELDEEERKQAWLEYEEEKKGKPPMLNAAYQNNVFLQQCMLLNSRQSGMMPQDKFQFEYDAIQQMIRKDYPTVTPEQLKMMTSRAMIDMYNYWEKQAALQQPIRNPVSIQNFQQRPMMMPHTGNMNAHMGNMNAHQQISQLNQLLTSGGYVNVNNPIQSNMAQRTDLVTNPFTYRNAPAVNANRKTDDVIEIMPGPSNASTSNAQVAVQSTNKSKDKEE